MLSTPWLLLGIDDLIRAVPDKGIDDGTLLHVSETGQVEIGPGWRSLEASWYVGIATIAASGTGVIVDEVFLDGGTGQDRLRAALGGLEVLWVGVTCDRDTARAREALGLSGPEACALCQTWAAGRIPRLSGDRGQAEPFRYRHIPGVRFIGQS